MLLLSFMTGIIKSICVKETTLFLFSFRHRSLVTVHTDLQWCVMYLSQLSGCPKLSQRGTPSSEYSGPGSVVGIVTCYRLDVWGLNPGGGEIFRTCPDWPWGPPSLLYSGYRVFPGGKERPGRDADPPPPSSAMVKKE